MAGSKSDYLEDAILLWRMGTPMPPPPATMYVGLLDGNGLEIAGNGYARQPIAWSKNGNRLTNSNLIRFPAASPGGYSVGMAGIFDAEVGGNMTDFDEAVTGQVAVGDNFRIDIGAISIIED